MSHVEKILAHYGVKGMRWGHRRTDAEIAEARVVAVNATPGKRVKTAGGKELPASEDAVKAAIARQKAKSSTVDSLSNAELQAMVTRMNLEQQYARLNSPNGGPIKQGHKFVKEALGAGKMANEVIAFDSTPAGQKLREALRDD